MTEKRAFTLIEIIIVMVVAGIFAALALPNFLTSMEQTKAQVARNNLYAIAAAQQKYNEDYGPSSWCVGACGTNLTTLNSNLHLSLGGSSDSFTYQCTAAAPYRCQAMDGTDTLTATSTSIGLTVTCASANNSNCPF